MGLRVVVEPVGEPVSLDLAKNHLRIDPDITDDDALIRLLISAARRYAEDYTSRSFFTQKLQQVLDLFPGAPDYVVPGQLLPLSLRGYASSPVILLRRGPVQSVEAVEYRTAAGWLTLSPDQYVLDTSSVIARLAPAAGCSWPFVLNQIGSVRISYTAGYGAIEASVPEGIRHWIMLRLTTLYQNREEVAIMSRGKVDPLPYVDSLLDFVKEPVI
ncbi:head-tail connector protein [Undibacterium curvum]|uniref:Phage head-tail connector protein n=1 Tax=Undibacterium curvum TaxID=2762294 RepID=A0ABR7A4Z6_9BURK|nr:head-tail connector protein [Undibacterium curvum]MBC3931982.1 phage head-tail connector protein [Undibacterium curvum]